MGSNRQALDARKAAIAVARDRQALEARFPGVHFEPLEAEQHQRAFAQLERFLVSAGTIVATRPLDDPAGGLGPLVIDGEGPLAIRSSALPSGAWFRASDAVHLLTALRGSEADELALFELESGRLHVVHRAEYAWEYGSLS